VIGCAGESGGWRARAVARLAPRLRRPRRAVRGLPPGQRRERERRRRPGRPPRWPRRGAPARFARGTRSAGGAPPTERRRWRQRHLRPERPRLERWTRRAARSRTARGTAAARARLRADRTAAGGARRRGRCGSGARGRRGGPAAGSARPSLAALPFHCSAARERRAGLRGLWGQPWSAHGGGDLACEVGLEGLVEGGGEGRLGSRGRVGRRGLPLCVGHVG
jgi:hypothetical protein